MKFMKNERIVTEKGEISEPDILFRAHLLVRNWPPAHCFEIALGQLMM
jgi:hypothetical protein